MNGKVRVTPEISEDLHAWLIDEAEDQHRSLHGQISYILQSYRKRLESGKVPVVGRGEVVAMQRVG